MTKDNGSPLADTELERVPARQISWRRESLRSSRAMVDALSRATADQQPMLSLMRVAPATGQRG